jgi:ferritin-like protein
VSDLTLEQLDQDGAIRETLDAAWPRSRAEFLRAALAGGGAVGAGFGWPDDAEAATSRHDVKVLNFDLVLEYLQAAFYTEAERLGDLKPTTLAWSRVVGAHERAHVKAIKGLLGQAAVKSPSFNFRGVTSSESKFIKTAVAFEDLTTALLNHQIPRFDSRAITAAALTLRSVEARHAAWIRHIVGIRPATTAFDQAVTQQRVSRVVAATGFIAARPRITRKKRPRFTG